ncbi:hypothetical protein D3C81_1831570 [compost metagenome]
MRIEPGGLLLHRAKRATDDNSCQLCAGVLRLVQVARQGDAIAVREGDLLMVHLVALGESLVPFLCQLHVLALHVVEIVPASLNTRRAAGLVVGVIGFSNHGEYVS